MKDHCPNLDVLGILGLDERVPYSIGVDLIN